MAASLVLGVATSWPWAASGQTLPTTGPSATSVSEEPATPPADDKKETPGKATTQAAKAKAALVVPPDVCSGSYEKRRTWVMDQAVQAAREEAASGPAENKWKNMKRNAKPWMAMAMFERGEVQIGREISHDFLMSFSRMNPDKVRAVDFFDVWPAMCLVTRWGEQIDPEAIAALKKYVTSINQYNRSFTPNLSMVMCASKYLGDQLWGPEAFVKQLTEPLDSWGYRSISKQSAHDRLMDICKKTALEGGSEYASRPYGTPNLAPIASLAALARDKDLKELADFTHQVTLARYATHWFEGNLVMPSGRSYPDYWNDPIGVARWFWTHFGGKVTPDKLYGVDMLCAAVLNAGPNELVLEAAQNRATPFVTRSRFNPDAGAHQLTYFTPRYAVFSNMFTAPFKSFSQTYPFGVRWLGPNTGPITMLWCSVPCYDVQPPRTERQISRPHGVHGSGQSVIHHNGTLLYVCDTTLPSVNNPHALCFVPSGALAVINESAVNQHIFLHYPGILISIATTAPFTWDPKASVTLPCSKNNPGDSEFRVKAPQFALVIDTEVEDAVPGATAEERLKNYREQILAKTKLELKPGSKVEGIYVNRQGVTIQRVRQGDAKVDSKKVDFTNWPQSESPWTHQDYNGDKFVLTAKGKKLTYDLKSFTVTESQP